MIFVLHVDDEPFTVMVDGRLIGPIPSGELFEVPELRGTDCNNNGPTEYRIPEKLVAQKIIEHGWYHGVVEVPMIRTKGGVTSDIEAAKKNAAKMLASAQETMLNKYITDQQDRVMKDNKPPLAPSAPIQKIIEKLGIDLDRDFNLKVPGLQVAGVRDRDAEIDTLKKQLADLMTRLGESESKKGK